MITIDKTENEQIAFAKGQNEPIPGTSGANTQLPGQPATVTGTAISTGGINAGNFIESDIDSELFHFNSEDAPLMNLMLCARKVKVNSPEVDHYMIDEPPSAFVTDGRCGGGSLIQAVLPLSSNDQLAACLNSTLLVKGVDGYDNLGNITPGRELMSARHRKRREQQQSYCEGGQRQETESD